MPHRVNQGPDHEPRAPAPEPSGRSAEPLDAQLRLADVYYLQESYAEAAMGYESFKDLHPRNERIPYALFRIGQSYHNDSPKNVARDLTPASRALEAFDEFIARFPQASDIPAAKKYVAEIRALLAAKELYIATFYSKRDAPDAARARLKKLIDLYPETPGAQEAKIRLQKIGSTKETSGNDKKPGS